MASIDTLGRPLRNLRLSVTDRCNLRCAYCMPEEEYTWLPRRDILDFEEISRLVDLFAELGVDKVRITGGEPLLRRDLPALIGMLAPKPAIKDLALTTNGILLGEQAQALHDAGLHRVTISLDTLHADRFQGLTRRDALPAVLAGIEAAGRAGFSGTKLDAVIMRGTNDDELVPLLEYAKRVGAEMRFIEYMDVGGATKWSFDQVMSRDTMLEVIGAHYGGVTPHAERSSAPADRFVLPDGTVFGIISSTTAPFCRACDRSRLTADGLWYLCLYARVGTDLRRALRDGASDAEIKELISFKWQRRRDRGAEDRLAAHGRGSLLEKNQLRNDPHLEMHTRGG
jgi:GTP 3',8-cyclase